MIKNLTGRKPYTDICDDVDPNQMIWDTLENNLKNDINKQILKRLYELGEKQ